MRSISARRRLAVVVIGALTVTAGAALTPSSPAQAAVVGITGGHIEWGVKSDFRSYVTGSIAQGTISLASNITGVAPIARASAVSYPPRTSSDQVVQGTDVYRFGVLPQGTNDSATRTASVASGGVVRFVGHGGQLDVTIDNIRVNLSGNAGTLVADVTSKPLPTEANPTPAASLYDDVVFANLNLSAVTPTTVGAITTYASIPASLAATGAPAFAGFYTAGAALDPVTVALRGPAAEPVVTGRNVAAGSVRWTISRQIWGQTSLNQCAVASDGASIQGTPSDATAGDAASGFSFPVASGKFNPGTGATKLNLTGAVVIGNRAQGDYRIKFDHPTLTVDGSGNGTLTADVSYSLHPVTSPPTPAPATCDLTGRVFVPGGTVVIATFANAALAQGAEVTGALVPQFAENVYSADPRLTSVLDPTLRAHFLVSNGNPSTSGTPAVEASFRKTLQPVRVGFTVAAPTPTTLALTPATASKQVNQQACVTATLTDELSLPIAGQSVAFTVTGPGAGSAAATTDAAGKAPYCFTSTATGTSSVNAGASSLSATATVKWNPPPAPKKTLLQTLLDLVGSLLGG